MISFPNWKLEQTERHLVIYEIDGGGSRKISGSVAYKNSCVKFETTVKARESILRSTHYDRYDFYSINAENLGNGLWYGFTINKAGALSFVLQTHTY